MVGSIRWPGKVLTSLSLIAGPWLAGGSWAFSPADPHPSSMPSQEPAQGAKATQGSAPAGTPGTGQTSATSKAKPDVAALFSQPGDDPPRPFVPLRPSTVDDRAHTEALLL